MAKPVHVTEQSFDQEVVKAETPVLVDFWAEWCGPGRLIAPIVEDFAREDEGKLKVAEGGVGGPRGPQAHLTDSPGEPRPAGCQVHHLVRIQLQLRPSRYRCHVDGFRGPP